MESVASGPMPGSTPINVPMRQPSSANAMLMGCIAWVRPSQRWPSTSMSEVRPDRDRQADAPDEDRDRHEGEHRRRGKHLDKADVRAGVAADQREQRGREN